MVKQSNKVKYIWWKDRDEKTVSRTLERLMKLITIENGKPNARSDFELDANIAILASLIEFSDIESEKTKRHLLQRTLFHLRTLKRRNLTGFRLTLDREAKKNLERQVPDWIFVFPINIDRRSLNKRRLFRIGDICFRIRKWSDLRKKLAIDAWESQAKFLHPSDVPVWQDFFIPLEVEVAGFDYNESFRIVEKAFTLLRVAFNWYPSSFKKVSRFGGGRSTPLVPIPPPPTYGIYNSNGDWVGIYTEEFPAEKYKSVALDDDHIASTNWFMKYFGDRDESKPWATKNLIVNAFLAYGQSLDSTNWRTVFLGLWQVLELITNDPSNRSKGVSMFEVCSRVRTLLKRDNLFLDDLLNMVYRQRNHLVHEGKFSDTGLDDVQYLKIIVENALKALISLEKNCPTWRSLVMYYKNAPAILRDVKERKRILGVIERRLLK